MQASTPVVVAAGMVRLFQLGLRLLYLKRNYQPTEKVVKSIIDLRQKLEALALTNDVAEQNIIKGYLQETYLLTGVYTDPLLRPQLPPIAGAAKIRRGVLGVNGGALRVNNALIAMTAELVVEESDTLQPGPNGGSTAPVVIPMPVGMTMPYSTVFTNKQSVTITHNLGRQVTVQVFDMDGDEMDGLITSTANSITVLFSQPLSGTIIIS
jgi:hypothetical protein